MGQNIAESRQLATLGAQLNRLNQYGPWGSLVFSGPSKTTATTTLSPAMQALFSRSLGFLGGFQPGKPFLPGQTAATQTGLQNPFNLQTLLGGGYDPNADRARVEQAYFQRAMDLLNPELGRSEELLRQRLANQGLPQAGQAFTAEMGRFTDAANRAREQAALSAVLAGGQEQTRQLGDILQTSQLGIGQAQAGRQQAVQEALLGRQIPLQEAMQLFGIAQPPQFFGPGQAPVQSMATASQGSPWASLLGQGLGTAGSLAMLGLML